MQYLDKFKNEMNLSGKNVYVGHRYVPKIMGDWDNTQIYEPLSIVQFEGNSFTSRQFVPSGIEITNEVYWVSTGNYNAQIEYYRQEVSNVNNEVVNARNGEANLNSRLDKDQQEITANLAQIANVVVDDTQKFLDDLADGSTVKFKREKYDLHGQVLILRNKENIVLDLTGTHFKQHFHGHGVLEIENCKNITIIGGVIEGSGNFPKQTFNGSVLINEKTENNDWGLYKNSERTTTTQYNNGYYGNVSFGLLINHGCENILIDEVEAFGFNYVGIGIGFIGTQNETVNRNVTIQNCYTHNNFSAGIHTLNVDEFSILNNRTENNGHPSTKESDTQINPGYGITARNSSSGNESKNGLIYNNVTKNNNRKGIDAHAGIDLLIDSNIVENCFYNGIGLASFNGIVRDITATKNTIINCGNSNDGVGIFVESGGYNVVSHNQVKNSGRNGTGSGIYFLHSDGLVFNNLVVDSGAHSCMRMYPINNLEITNNTVKNSEQKTMILMSASDEISEALTVIVKNNTLLGDFWFGLSFDGLKNGVVSGNFIETKRNHIAENCTLHISNDNVGLQASEKTNASYSEPLLSIVEVNIVSGNITFKDSNNLVDTVVSHTNGLTVNLKDGFYAKGISYIPNSSDNYEYSNVSLREITSSKTGLNVSLGTDSSPFGKEGSTVTKFKGLFILVAE